METPFSCGLVWLRRDLRVSDHAALHHALQHCQRVHVVFVFDIEILDVLPRADRRVEFIRESLVEVDARLREMSGHPLAGIGNLKCTAAHTSSHTATHATSHAATLLLSTQTAAGLEWI